MRHCQTTYNSAI